MRKMRDPEMEAEGMRGVLRKMGRGSGWPMQAIRILAILLLLYPFVRLIVRNWRDVYQVLGEGRWQYFGLSLLLMAGVMPFISTMTWSSLRRIGFRFPLWKTGGLYYFWSLYL